MKVKIPKKVADALDYHKNLWTLMSPADRDLMLMSIPFALVHGQSLIIKNFAKENPSLYLQALANGYEPIMDIREELAQMLNEWLDKPYADVKGKDIQEFADTIVNHIQKQK